MVLFMRVNIKMAVIRAGVAKSIVTAPLILVNGNKASIKARTAPSSGPPCLLKALTKSKVIQSKKAAQ